MYVFTFTLSLPSQYISNRSHLAPPITPPTPHRFPDLESRYTSTRGVLDTKKFPGAALTPKYQDLVYENSLPPPLVSSAKK